MRARARIRRRWSRRPRRRQPDPRMPRLNSRTNPSSLCACAWRPMRRRRCTTSPARGWWCGSPTRICATPTPTAARTRRIGAREQSTGSAFNGTREKISRTNRWNFWPSCPRRARQQRRNSLVWLTGLSWSATLLGIGSDALFADETHVNPPAVWREQHHIVFFGPTALHPGRADRHPGHGEAGRVRFLGKEALERNGGYVSLDDIARELRRVAGGEIVGNAEPFLHRIDVRSVQNLRDEARIVKVLDPTRTAAAAWILVNRNHLSLAGKERAGLQERRDCREKR